MSILVAMDISVIRVYNCPDYCIGRMYVDGQYFCDTIEDTDRGLLSSMSVEELMRMKVYSKTAIPVGCYRVTCNFQSPKFVTKQSYYNFCRGFLPRLLNVPAYAGILIHAGNITTGVARATMSAGCILVGRNTVKGCLTDSWKTFQRLYAVISIQDPLYIDITRRFVV